MRPRIPLLALALAFIPLLATPAAACPYCEQRPLVWAGIFNEDFLGILLQVTLAVPLLIAAGLVFHLADHRAFRPAVEQSGASGVAPVRRGPFLSAGVTLGIGLGGFLDGIFLHMLLQWHNLIAERLPPVDFVSLEINMFWDGIFNLGMWLITAVGLGLLWRAGRLPGGLWSGRSLLGALLVGWGIFNVADSILFHWVFQLHHIKQGAPNWLFWDLTFFFSGLVLIGVGWVLMRSGSRQQTVPTAAAF